MSNKCLTSVWKVGAIVEQTLGGRLDVFGRCRPGDCWRAYNDRIAE